MRESKARIVAALAAACALSLASLATTSAQAEQDDTQAEPATVTVEESAAAASDEIETSENGGSSDTSAEGEQEGSDRFEVDRSELAEEAPQVGKDSLDSSGEEALATSSPTSVGDEEAAGASFRSALGAPRRASAESGSGSQNTNVYGSCILRKGNDTGALPGCGVAVVTSTGEVYQIKPGTKWASSADTMVPLPRLPKPDNVPGAERGRNFNALATGSDGTTYVVERTGSYFKDPHTGKPIEGSSRNDRYNKVVLRFWKLKAGATAWERVGSYYNLKDATNNLGSNLEIQGGAVNPANGNYFFGGVGIRQNPKDSRKKVKAYLLFEMDKDTGEVTPRGWINLGSSNENDKNYSTGNGSLVFSTEGDLLVGIGYKRQESGRNPRYQPMNRLEIYSVPSVHLKSSDQNSELSVSGRESFDLLKYGKSDDRSTPPLANVRAASAFSFQPDGSVLISTGRVTNDIGYLFKVSGDGDLTLIQQMPEFPPVVGETNSSTGDTCYAWKPGMEALWASVSVETRLYNNCFAYRLPNRSITDLDGGAASFFASITVKKNIAARKDARDQFTVSASIDADSWNAEGAFETKGASSGVQGGQVGPIAIPSGQTVHLSEELAGVSLTPTIADYKPKLQCVDGNGEAVSAAGDVQVLGREASADVTIPASGGAASQLTCTFVNDPGPSTGTIELVKKDQDSQSTLPGAVFKLCADKNGNGAYEENDCASSNSDEESRKTTDAQGFAKWDSLDFGTYFLVEEQTPKGYTLPLASRSQGESEYRQAVDSSAHPVAGVYKVELNADTVRGEVVNARRLGEVTWKKGDDSKPAHLLGGSQWTLMNTTTGEAHTITDCDHAPCSPSSLGSLADTDPAKGSLRVDALSWGEWELKESKAPAGYVLNPNLFPFTINAQHLNENLPMVTNAKAKLPALPFTGGASADVFRLSALGVLALAALSALYLRRRKAVV